MGTRMSVALALAAALSAGCSSNEPDPAAGRGGPAAHSRAAQALGSCPPPAGLATLPVLATLTGDVDDMFAAPDGTVWVTDRRGRVLRLSTDGMVLAAAANSGGPEGIVASANGTILLVEQDRDRVVALQSLTRADDVRPVGTLGAVLGKHDLDGIAVDAQRGRLLIPDSAQGVLRAMPLAGGPLTTIAFGLDRPVGVTVAPEGVIYVAQRSGVGLVRIARDGDHPLSVGTVTGVDEIVAGRRLLYVARTDNSVAAVDPETGASRMLVRGVNSQGLALLPGGRLAVADATSGTITTTRACE